MNCFFEKIKKYKVVLGIVCLLLICLTVTSVMAKYVQKDIPAGSFILSIPQNKEIFAVYGESFDENNNSLGMALNFYNRAMPEVNETIIYDNGKQTVTEIYTGFDTDVYSNQDNVPWYADIHNNVKHVNVIDEFAPVSIAYWFGGPTYNNGNYTELESVDIQKIDTSNIESMKWTFAYCTALKTITFSDSLDTDKVESMNSTFAKLLVLESWEFLRYLDTSSVKDMSNMFQACTMTSLDLSSFNTSMVTDMKQMFYNCANLETLDLSTFDTSSVKDMSNMFSISPGSNSLKTIYVSDKFVTTNVTNSNSTSMFTGCNNLVGGAGTGFVSGQVDKTYARIDGGSEHPGYFTYKKYALVFEAGDGTGAPDVMLSENGVFENLPNGTGMVSTDGYPLLGWATTEGATEAVYMPGSTFTSSGTEVPCCDKLYAVYDKPIIVTDGSQLADAMESGKDLIIEGGTYTYMEGFAAGINITLNNVICKNYFVANYNSNIVINGLDGTKSTTSPLLDTGSGSTVTINDAITGNLGGVVNIGRNATLIINGGTYNRPMLVKEGNPNSNLIINGGTFTNVTSVSDLVGSVGNVTIKGGTFGFDPTDSGYVAEGYIVVDNGNGTWSVVEASE